MPVEFWTSGRGLASSGDPSAFTSARQAQRAEELGFDGITFVDSQNRASDCYVALTVAAHSTTRLKLGTGVTNSYTRHPAVTASAIAAIQAESGGRAYLGIGRGDSALAHLGLAPHAVPKFERYLEQLQGYLRGEEVPFGEIVGPVTDTQRDVLTKIHDSYDMHGHAREGSPQSAQVTQEFAGSFGIFGPPDYCVERLGELIELGITRFYIAGTTLDPSHPYSECSERFISEVAPQLRR